MPIIKQPVRILKPSLDDVGRQTVLRGIIDNDSLKDLRTDYYQRELMPESNRRDIITALENNTQLPDIELGMRGQTFTMPSSSLVTLEDPTYIIDGLQRVGSLLSHLAEFPTAKNRLGAIIHIGTTADWERERFHILNSSRIKVSVNKLLHNLQNDCAALATLHGLSKAEPDFVLHNRVCWRQRVARDHLITAANFIKVSLRLHAHLAPTRSAMNVDGLITASTRVADRIGLAMMRENTRRFWSTIDELWGVKNLTSRDVPYLRGTFLSVLSDIFCNHTDFWAQPNEAKFVVPYQLKNKLKIFPIYDPEVIRLSGASGKAMEALYFIILTHINSGKRTQRLTPRNAAPNASNFTIGDDEEEEVAA
jgi:hypothetical protein